MIAIAKSINIARLYEIPSQLISKKGRTISNLGFKIVPVLSTRRTSPS